MARQQRVISEIEMFSSLTDALRTAAIQPGLAGYKPQDHQLDFHLSEKRGRLFIGGNRSGKTVGATADACAILEGKHPVWSKEFPPPVRGRAIGVDFDNGVELILIPEYKRWISKTMLIDGSWDKSYNKSLRQLTLVNGSTIEFRSYDQDLDKFSGTSRHFIHFDEEPPEDIYNENMARLIDTNGVWFISMTPLIDQSWTEDRLYTPAVAGHDPDIAVFEVATSQNKYVSETAINTLFKGLNEEDKAARIQGQYTTYANTIYKPHIKPGTIIPDIRGEKEWEQYKAWGHFIMLDHGFTNPTACLFACFNREGRIIIYDEYYERGRVVKENAYYILQKIEELGIEPQYGVIDPTTRNTDAITGTSIHAEYAEHGLSFGLGNNNIPAGIERCISRFKQQLLLITENCKMLRWEVNRYRWDKFASSKIAAKNNAKEKPLMKDDHAMDAMRYGVVSRPQLFGELDLSKGNVLNKPVVSVKTINFDTTLMGSNQEQNATFDDVLGDCW